MAHNINFMLIFDSFGVRSASTKNMRNGQDTQILMPLKSVNCSPPPFLQLSLSIELIALIWTDFGPEVVSRRENTSIGVKRPPLIKGPNLVLPVL